MEPVLRLVLGDQLNLNHSWFKQVEPNVTYLMMEVRQETDFTLHHIQKIIAFFAAMREFSGALKKYGHTVRYITLDDPQNTQSIPENCSCCIEKLGINRFEYLLPDEYRIDCQLRDFTKTLSIPFQAYDTEHFFTERDETAAFFRNRKTYIMEPFYRDLRMRFSILVTDDGKPEAGRWNFDSENRKALPDSAAVPEKTLFSRDVTTLYRTIKESGVSSFGSVAPEDFRWPVTRSDALRRLDHFLNTGLPSFGKYQDAMSRHHPILFHSLLSFPLNSKLISPRELITRTLEFWKRSRETDPDSITIAQVEGFIRQILGWREYMRGVYWSKMPEYAGFNYFNHHAALPEWYWTGRTKMNCLKQTISGSLNNAYAHHIQRLMVTGNFALLAGVHPDEVDAWYLGIYIDALEWVELPNTRGMSQFADGGFLGSKPYVSSAAYINRMSDYCKYCTYNPKKRYGENACPFNSLYWSFFLRHQQKLKGSPRMGFVYKNLEKMKESEKMNIEKQAKAYRSTINDV